MLALPKIHIDSERWSISTRTTTNAAFTLGWTRSKMPTCSRPYIRHPRQNARWLKNTLYICNLYSWPGSLIPWISFHLWKEVRPSKCFPKPHRNPPTPLRQAVFVERYLLSLYTNENKHHVFMSRQLKYQPMYCLNNIVLLTERLSKFEKNGCWLFVD